MQEDAHVAELSIDDKHTSLFAVFDGHGGGSVARFAANHVASELMKLPSYSSGDLVRAMNDVYYQIDLLLDTQEGQDELHAISGEGTMEEKGLFSHMEDKLLVDGSVQDKFDSTKKQNIKEEDVSSENNTVAEAKENSGGDPKPGIVRVDSTEEFRKSALQRHSVILTDENEPKAPQATEDSPVKFSLVPGAEGRNERNHAANMGCTAVAALVRGSTLIVANTGDSRCVLCRKGEAEPLTLDHKPILFEEAQRIIRAGGFVKDNRVNGALNVSRTLGDLDFKRNESLPHTEQMVVATPDVQELKLEEGMEFLILACDGIWDVLSNQEAVNFVRKRLKAGQPISSICEQICDHCLAPDLKGLCRGADNMSIIIIHFKRYSNLNSAVNRFWNACVGLVRKNEFK